MSGEQSSSSLYIYFPCFPIQSFSPSANPPRYAAAALTHHRQSRGLGLPVHAQPEHLLRTDLRLPSIQFTAQSNLKRPKTANAPAAATTAAFAARPSLFPPHESVRDTSAAPAEAVRPGEGESTSAERDDLRGSVRVSQRSEASHQLRDL